MEYPQLDAQVLTKLATGVKIPDGELPLTRLFMPTKVEVEGDIARWDEVLPIRTLDTVFETRDQMATNTASGTVKPRSSTMVTTFKKRQIKPEVLRNMRAIGSEAKASAEQKLALLVGDMTRRYWHERWEMLIANALLDTLSFTIDGVTHTPDFGLDVTHDVDDSGGAPWSTAGTDIDAAVEAAKRVVAADSGRALKTVLCGRNIFGYLRKNTAIKSWFQNQPGASETLRTLSADTISGLFGLNWVQINAGYISGGVWTPYLPDAKCVFIPDISQDWFQVQVGTVMYPTQAYGTNPLQFAETYGMAAWSRFYDEPPSSWFFNRWHGLAVPVFPSAYYVLKVA